MSMTRILFVGHWNVCRSPMAEYVMKDLVTKAGLESQFYIASSATSQEKLGNSIYPLAQQELEKHGINCNGHIARQLQNSDYEKYDLLIGMDNTDIHNIYLICGGDFADKIRLLMDFTDHPGEVADPWCTDDFEATWRDVSEGCRSLIERAIFSEEKAT